MFQDDWLNRINAPYLEAAKKRQAGYLPVDFAGQFEEIPERGFWDAALAGAKSQAAGTVASQAEALNIMGVGDGATAQALNEIAQENARRREYTWQDMVNEPMKYITDPEGLTYDLAGGLASTAVFMGETAALGGVGGVAARATGLANKIGGTARLVQGIKTVAEANNMPWLSKIMESPSGKMLVLNVMKTPLESLSIAGSAGKAVGEQGGTLEQQRSAALQAGALNTVVGAFTNTLESVGLGKLIAKEGGKDLFTKKVASVVSAAADGASKPNFVQKIRQYELNKGALANYGKSAIALTGNALLNAYEEGAQETIEQYTTGKKGSVVDIINPFTWDDEALTSAAIGGVTGAGQGAVMTGVGKGLNTLFGVDEQSDKKVKDFKPTTAAKKTTASAEESEVVKDSLTTQPQPLTAEQQELTQAQSESYDEAFGVDEESIRDFEEKQSQKLSETVGSGVDEETAEAEYQRRNELMQLALGMDIPQFVGTKTKEQAKQSPQSPVKANNWNRVHKGTNISIPQKELPTPTFERTPQNYVGSYTTQGIEKAINQSDNKLKELAHKIQHFDDSDRLKINVFRELRRRGIALGENFSIDADESQIIPYGSTELSTEQPQDFQKAEAPATVTQVPRERVQQAIDKYVGQPQMFKQHINDLISFVGKAVAENRISKDEAKVAVAQIKAFHDEVVTAIGGTIRQYSKNTPPKSKAQNAKTSYLALPEATQKAIEESPEQAEEIFEQEAQEYVNANINNIVDINERKKVARLDRDNAHEHLRSLLKPALDILNKGRNNGYSFAEGNQDNGRMVRVSNNDVWYQEFRKERKHKPLVPEMEELAYQLLIDKFPYTKPAEWSFEITPDEYEAYENELRELKQQLDYARAYYFALDEAYNNALEESKQQAKEKGDKNGKSQNQQTSKETNKSKDDGNTALESSEEKKTDGEVEEVEISNKETEKHIDQEEYNKTAQEFWVKTANYIARKYSALADDVLSTLTGDIKNTYELLSEIGLSNQDIKKAFPVFEKLYLNRIATRHKYDDATNHYVSLYWKIVGGIIREIQQNGIDFVTVSSNINAIIDEASKEVEKLADGNKEKKLISQKATELKKQLNPNVDEQTLVNELAEQNAYLLSKQAKSAPQQEKKAKSKEMPIKEEKVAENGDFPAKIGDYKLVPLKKGNPSNMRDYQNPSSPSSDFYNVLVDSQTGVVYVTGSGMTEGEELGFPAMQDAVNFIRDGEAYKGLSAKEVKSKQAMVKRMESGEVIKPTENETPKVPKATQAVIDYVKEQTNLDLTPCLDNTFKAKRGQMNIRITSMSKVQLNALKMFVYKTSQGYGSYQIEIEDLGNWGITLKFKKKDGSNPVKYSATELDKKFQAAYHGSPHIFNEFSLKYIGTGEGAQAHGYGLYFAQDEAVAQSYRKNLTNTDESNLPFTIKIGNEIMYVTDPLGSTKGYINGNEATDSELDALFAIADDALVARTNNTYTGKISKIVESLQNRLNLTTDDYYKKILQDRIVALTKLSKNNDEYTFIQPLTSGSVFEVDIPDNDVLLDENKALINQPDKVKKALQELSNKLKFDIDVLIDDLLPVTNEILREVKGRFSEFGFINEYISDALRENITSLEYNIAEKYSNKEALNKDELLEETIQTLKEHIDGLIEQGYASQKPRFLIDRFINRVSDAIYDSIDGAIQRKAGIFQDDMTGKSIYDTLVKITGTPLNASMLLNDHGIKGITYVGGRDGHCYVIFDDKAIAIKRRYDTAMVEHQNEIKEAADKQKALLKDALKGGKFEIQDNGDYKVTMPNGVVIYASVKDQIVINPLEMQGAKAAHGLKGNAISILGSFQKITSDGIDALINLSASTAKDTTAYHEVTHALIELALTQKQKQLIFNTLEPMAQEAGKDLEEFVCDYVADWRLKRKNANMFGKLWQKIFDMAKRLQAWFTQTENMHNLLRKIETGEVWKQTAEMQAKEYSPANNKYFATDLAERFQEFLHGEEDVFESEQYKKHNELRREAQEQSDALWKEYKALDEKIESLMPSLDSDKAKELVKEYQLDLDFYSDIQMLRMMLKHDVEFGLKEVRKQKNENFNKRKKLDYEVRKNRILAKRIVDKASRQLRKKHFFTEPPKPTNQSEFEGFTIETTGMSGYDDVLEQIDVDKGGYRYTRNSKYGLAYIAEMSPLEYMDRCALEIFKRTYHSNLYGTLASDGDVDKYADMMKNGTKFHLPMLNYNKMQQEGRHRALAAYLNGIEKIPVLVVGQPEYNLISTKYSAEESAPKTATAKVSYAMRNSRPKDFWAQVKEKGFFKSLWDKFYTDWVDKLKPLEMFDQINSVSLGRELKQEEKVRERAQAVSYNAAGIAHVLLDGNSKDLEAVNAMLKNKKLPHEATLQMVLDKIKLSAMNEKYGKQWLKDNGFEHWFEALSNYLLARRLREMWNRRKADYDEQIQIRDEAISTLDETLQEKIKKWDKEVLEWERNGKEGKKPKKPKDLQILTDKLEDVTQLPLWSDMEYSLPQNLSIDVINQMIAESPKEFSEAAEVYYKLNDNLLTVLEDAGIISEKTHNILNTKYKEYCPLMRDFTDTAGADDFIDGLTSGGKGLANVAIPLHKIKAEGSERAVTSPLESTINAISVFTQRAERNKVAQLALEMVNKSGAKQLLMEMPYGTKPSVRESTFTILTDGKKKVYQCEPSMYGAIAGYNIPTASMVFKVASTAANMLRVGATSSPSFILRNLIRDTIFAGISSKNGFIPIYDTIRGWKALKNNPQLAAEFHAAGVDQFSFYGNGESRYNKLAEMAKEDNHSIFNPLTWIKFFREYSELAEASTRMGEYIRAKEKGKDIRIAAEDARNVTLNFTRSGVRGEQVNKVIPFFNAVIQGGDKMMRMFREDFVGTCTRTFTYIILPSLALWALNHDEDWYKKLNPEIKNQYWCLGKNLKVPKPQELGVLFGSGSEAILDTASGIDKRAINNWSKAFLGNLLPNFIPTVLLPIVEWQANYNFFRGKEVVSKKLQRLPDELQFTDATSGISKAIGGMAKISPAKIDNLVMSASGTMGMLFYQGLGLPLDEAKNVPAKHWFELPFFRDFAVTNYNLNRNVNEFYEIYNASEKQHTGYGKKGSPSIATKNIRNAYKAISDINKDIQKIQNSSRLSAERKRVLMDKKRNQIEKIAEKIVRKYGEYYM